MDYLEAEEGRARSGLRLVLTYRTPNVLAEGAKAICHVKGLSYAPVAQHPGEPNAVLQDWTGYRNAPLAVWNDEPARGRWYEILMLAERLAPDPPLLPADRAQHALVMGLSHELMSEDGLGWNWRLMMFPNHASGERYADQAWSRILQRNYGGSAETVQSARDKVAAILAMLAARLHAQRLAGSPYLVGEALTAIDIYWAMLSLGVVQAPEGMFETPAYLQKAWGRARAQIEGDIDPILVEHRDRIIATYLPQTLDF